MKSVETLYNEVMASEELRKAWFVAVNAGRQEVVIG